MPNPLPASRCLSSSRTVWLTPSHLACRSFNTFCRLLGRCALLALACQFLGNRGLFLVVGLLLVPDIRRLSLQLLQFGGKVRLASFQFLYFRFKLRHLGIDLRLAYFQALAW